MRLPAREIDHVAEEPTDGGAQYMQDIEAACRHDLGCHAGRDAGVRCHVGYRVGYHVEFTLC
jgi:hypothetical protein